MNVDFIQIENFRGIRKTRLALASKPRQKVFALVGLNESGKTTILEAINHFSYKDENLDPLQLPGYSIKDLHSLIPIAQRANFNGIVQFELGLHFTEGELASIRTFAKQELNATVTNVGTELTITHKVAFKDSKYDEAASGVWWGWKHEAKKGKSRTARRFTGEDWQKLVRHTKTFIPAFLYFPTFLFEFPERIYLEDAKEERDKHAFYGLVLQDILDAYEAGASLKTHLLDRAKSDQPSDKKNLESLLLKMGRHVTETVFSAWNQIFRRRQADRRIVLTWDSDEQGRCFIQFKIEDSDGYYQINERSMGFRWFFAFLLLAQYRAFRRSGRREVIFLFDEPASNLHSSAQVQLLKSFEHLAKTFTIIYTTHSHHMIDPRWLEGTFVVKNLGISYAGDPEPSNPRNTDITATKYREFATKNPEQTSYYQPILDVLDYAPSKLENIPRVIITEGKGDYYILKYVNDVLLGRPGINLIPGTGAGSNDTLIKLYLAWNRPFVLILDADDEGTRQRERYRDTFGAILKNQAFTLADIDRSWKGLELEDLFENSELLAIQQSAYPAEERLKKTHFQRALQELYLTRVQFALGSASLERIHKLLEFADHRLSELSAASL